MAATDNSLELQYASPTNFNARVELHARFSTNRASFRRWIFDRVAAAAEARVLEIGCGTGTLWQANGDRIAPGWRVTLSDFSAGMLDATRRALADVAHPFEYRQCDAENLPFPDHSFDAVIANHMLYHVPDLPRGLGEIARVLRPGGGLVATTMGDHHLAELDALFLQFLGVAPMKATASRFSLDNGGAQLAPWFAPVEIARYETALVITEREPLMNYIRSMRIGGGAGEERLAALATHVDAVIAAEGAVRARCETGMFIARRGAV